MSRTQDSRPDSTAPTRRSRGTARGPVARVGLFYRQVIAELRKVVWPKRYELQTYVYTVIVFVVVMMALVYGLDWIFVKTVSAILG